MIVCPNCDHHNPEGASQCEACYTPLPEMVPCSNCGAPVQVDANFCGQCGMSTQAAAAPAVTEQPKPSPDGAKVSDLPTALEASMEASVSASPLAEASGSDPEGKSLSQSPDVPLAEDLALDFEADLEAAVEASSEMRASPPAVEKGSMAVVPASSTPTQLQLPRAKLLHIRSNVTVDLPESLSVVHLGKANDRVPPDIDVSGFPDSEVVSRVHADIRVEGDAYYIEDLGSSNGTYVNNLPLVPGNRHRLRVGDRISLGKGDLVTFLFQVA